MSRTEVQWRVTWFPPGRPDGFSQPCSGDQVRRLANEKAEYAPVIESRTVLVDPWQIVELAPKPSDD